MDWANLFAEWMVHNAVEKTGDCWWAYRHKQDRLLFAPQLALVAWIQYRRRSGLPYPTLVEIRRVVATKPYWTRKKPYGVEGQAISVASLDVAKCHEAGLDVPNTLHGVYKANYVYRKEKKGWMRIELSF